MTTINPEDNPSNFPSVDTAYPLAVASYETALKRFDMMDGRIQSLLTFAATVTIAFPALAGGLKLSMQPGLLFAGLVLFALASGLSIAARFKGDLLVLSPRLLFETELSKSEWTFKKDFIYSAGVTTDRNLSALGRRYALLLWSLIFYVAEFVVLAGALAYPWLAG